MEIKLLNGDCLIKLKELEDNSVDSIVTDPPYELGFMGKKWDSSGIAFNTDVWDECLRVLKPGGHLLAFGGTRTYHRMTVAIEDSGFEIRDCIFWCYGSGFPKSHNIGKAVDKLEGNKREIVGKKTGQGDIRGKNGLNGQIQSERPYIEVDITKGTSNFEGWGTALKPAVEPVVMARKPLSEKNIAQNVIKWGTGGINIDESRIHYKDDNDLNNAIEKRKSFANTGGGHQDIYVNGQLKKPIDTINSLDTNGRFPANLILDKEAGKMLDEQSGITKSSKRGSNNNKKTEHTNTYTPPAAIYNDENTYGDTGGASRFFYEVKPDEDESFNTELEPVVMARKPLSEKNIAQNVIKWGTGGINIDESRIASSESDKYDIRTYDTYHKTYSSYSETEEKQSFTVKEKNDLGRFPANLIIDEEAGKKLDEQSGNRKGFASQNCNNQKLYGGNSLNKSSTTRDGFKVGFNDEGGASRFFYSPKVSKKERNEGMDKSTNNHPTIKPTSLMLYLIRLVTPKGGTVLDPFMGSGSTGKAAVRSGFNFVGIEREKEYYKIAKSRIEYEKEKLENSTESTLNKFI